MPWFGCCKIFNYISKSIIDTLVCKTPQNFCIKVKFKHLFSFPVTVNKGHFEVSLFFHSIFSSSSSPSPPLLPLPLLLLLLLPSPPNSGNWTWSLSLLYNGDTLYYQAMFLVLEFLCPCDVQWNEKGLPVSKRKDFDLVCFPTIQLHL